MSTAAEPATTFMQIFVAPTRLGRGTRAIGEALLARIGATRLDDGNAIGIELRHGERSEGASRIEAMASVGLPGGLRQVVSATCDVVETADTVG